MLIDEVRERARRCLVAGALGDAWGGPYEGRPALDGASFTKEPHLSDDTMLTLATCEAVILDQGSAVPDRVAVRFVDWFTSGRLVDLGSGTLKALRDLSAGAHWALSGVRGEYAAGSGAAMRAAPLAFLLDPRSDDDRRVIRDICRITHHSDEAYSAALAIIAAIRVCLEASTVPADLFSRVLEFLPDTAVRDRIEEMSSTPIRVAEAARKYGNSGYSVHAIPLALLAAVQTVGQPLEVTIVTAISAGGDTDTIASMAAQIAGASGQLAPEKETSFIPGIETVRETTEAFVSWIREQTPT